MEAMAAFQRITNALNEKLQAQEGEADNALLAEQIEVLPEHDPVGRRNTSYETKRCGHERCGPRYCLVASIGVSDFLQCRKITERWGRVDNAAIELLFHATVSHLMLFLLICQKGKGFKLNDGKRSIQRRAEVEMWPLVKMRSTFTRKGSKRLPKSIDSRRATLLLLDDAYVVLKRGGRDNHNA